MQIRLTQILAAAALGLLASGCAGAMAGNDAAMAGRDGGMDGGAMMMSMGPMVHCRGAPGTPDERLARLHNTLHIASAQEARWAVYADAYRRSAAAMDMGGMDRSAAPAAGGASLPGRVQRHEAMMSTHLASLQALRATLVPLYDSLNADQKVIADAMACDMPRHTS